ncbi:MAG: cytochrome-c peroxidase [Saprospiraceae bacterium]|nr:cytochrome-c peroxidase [Saprospiraceae bacterium]HMW40585.1 cytochrome c peroxidase [Saprospiraceae bacterium]HMX88143.1 cytochrome c peroxidase [Saprospiraceae bacterium]HMZ38890.1 cytochrome c peroxidase [Saprospiraceae bacterium]HNA64869.1 cytochrome c peroxidase [Saprospiraceae bacterium]
MKAGKVMITISVMAVLNVCAASFVNEHILLPSKKLKLEIPSEFPKPYYLFYNNSISLEKFNLGKKLFYDPILSSDSSTSCASCHHPAEAFADRGHPLSEGVGHRLGIRNTPSLQNLIWKDNLMWDGGINHIEFQPLSPLTNKDEMNENLENLLIKLRRNPEYKAMFKSAFEDTVINSEMTLKSISIFLGLLISANSDYDKYVRKEKSFSQEQQRGLNLFINKCSHCHTPPLFTNNTFELNGLPYACNTLDSGRARITGAPQDYYKFKVPSLRNVSVTSPWMHDGRFNTLESVLDHYADLPSSTTSGNPGLQSIGPISNDDKKDIIEFLKTLTDTVFLQDQRFTMDHELLKKN